MKRHLTGAEAEAELARVSGILDRRGVKYEEMTISSAATLRDDVNVTSSELGTMLIYAERYAMGRSTAAPTEVCDLIRKYWNKLDKNDRECLVRDVNTAIERGRPLGMSCDAVVWKDLAAWMRTLVVATPITEDGAYVRISLADDGGGPCTLCGAPVEKIPTPAGDGFNYRCSKPKCTFERALVGETG